MLAHLNEPSIQMCVLVVAYDYFDHLSRKTCIPEGAKNLTWSRPLNPGLSVALLPLSSHRTPVPR
jgi:hypothetical protein